MPLRSRKMNFFIFGFQRRVWWPKWTPASRRSFMVTSLIAKAPSVDRPPATAACADRRPAGVRDGAPPGAALVLLTLRELEALARPRLSVLLALLHARVAREKAFLAQRPPQRLVEPDERARDSELDRAGLAGETTARGGHVDVVARGRVGGH